MIDFKDRFIRPHTSIAETIQRMDSMEKPVLVVNEQHKLVGMVSDKDIRIGLLQGIALEQPVSTIMDTQPPTVEAGQSRKVASEIMHRLDIEYLPVVDGDGRVVGMEFGEAIGRSAAVETLVVLMAGGLGTRLHPITRSIPKPMLQVGEQPLLEIIIRNFIAQGYRRFVLSLNYKAEVISNYFGDGTAWGAEIRYVYEAKPMGTAGGLSLLEEEPESPFIVMNGDLLTSVNFRRLMDYHNRHRTLATMCVHNYAFQVPYGMVESQGVHLIAVVEKPEWQSYVNAGIYVIDPAALRLIPRDRFFDMPELFRQIRRRNDEAVVFPIYENWLDIGSKDDLDRARREWSMLEKDAHN